MIRARVRPQKPYLDENNYWYVTRHADCKIVLTEGNSSKDFSHVDPDNMPIKGWVDGHLYNQHQAKIRGEAAVQLFITEDEPQRSQITKILHDALAPSKIKNVSDIFRSKTVELLEKNSNSSNFDMIKDLINLLTDEYIMSIINIPELNENRSELIDACRKAIYYYFGLGEHIEPLFTRVIDDNEQALTTINKLLAHTVLDYFITPREEDNLLNSFISVFKDDLFLVGFNIVGTIITLLGFESSLTAITATILQDKSIVDKLQQQEKILPSHIDELIRVSMYKPQLHRVLEQDIVIDDIVMKKGMIVTIDITSAGFDPEVFPMPYEVDFSRPIKNTISYSYGLHSCLGRVLSRELGVIYVEELLKYISKIELTDNIQFLMVSQLVEPVCIPVKLNLDRQIDLV